MIWIHIGRLNASAASLGIGQSPAIVSLFPEAKLKLDSHGSYAEVYCSGESLQKYSFKDLRQKFQADFNQPESCWLWIRSPQSEEVIVRTLKASQVPLI